MKKYLFIMIMAFVPSLLMAQAAGGTIKRTSKKTQTTAITPRTTSSTINKISQSPKKSKEEILQNIIENMVYVEGGTFMMGNEENQEYAPAIIYIGKAHKVSLSSFYIGKFEVTQEEWFSVMESNPSKFKGEKRPVENINWEDCLLFIEKLNRLTGKKFRLPTEAEWEYAARGGVKSKGFKYSGSNNLSQVACWEGSDDGILNKKAKTHNVGQRTPNELGIYDMSGNVLEWCMDGYKNSELGKLLPEDNPIVSTNNNDERIIRGGWYDGFSRYCETRERQSRHYRLRAPFFGFRLALSK